MQKRAAVILTDEKQMGKEAKLVSAMLNMAGKGVAKRGGNSTQDLNNDVEREWGKET